MILDLFENHNKSKKEELKISEDSNNESVEEVRVKPSKSSLIIDPDKVLEF
jgi:hypothetical protein